MALYRSVETAADPEDVRPFVGIKSCATDKTVRSAVNASRIEYTK